MIRGYARVSTDGQSLDAQHSALAAAGAEKIFAEKISGAVTDRAALARCPGRVPGSRWHRGRLRQSPRGQIPRGEVSRRRSRASHRRHTNCRRKFAAFRR